MMPLEKSAKLSKATHDRLTKYRDENGHSSIDSAVRELLMEVEA